MADTTNGVDPTVELQNGDAPTPAPAVEEQPQLHEETVGLTPAEKFKAEAESTVSGASTPKVNGKKSAGIDLTSDEAFPSLGGPGKAPAAAASWGARSGAVSGSSPAAASNWAPAIVGNTAQLRHELTKENKRDPKDLNPAYLKKGLGAADIVRDIMKKTNTKIESQLFKETGATTYIITGTVQGRDMARRLINKELAAKVSSPSSGVDGCVAANTPTGQAQASDSCRSASVRHRKERRKNPGDSDQDRNKAYSPDSGR